MLAGKANGRDDIFTALDAHNHRRASRAIENVALLSIRWTGWRNHLASYASLEFLYRVRLHESTILS
jgi:hypothetical protein